MRLFLICFLFCMPCFASAQQSDQPSGTITVEDTADRDAAIAVRIRDILTELDGYEDVTVTVSSGIVTLRGTTIDSATAARLNDLSSRVEGVVAIENDVTETTDVVERLNPAMHRFRARIVQLIAFMPLLLVALAAFALITVLGLLLARLKYPWDRIAPNAFIADIYRQILRLGFVLAGIVIALDILGATALLSTILGAAGIVGLAIGFAVRDTVENFIASVLLSVRQPFRPNDTIEIGGDTGKVIRLTSRATILLSFDGNHIRIPNATVFKSRIVNYSRNDERRFVYDLSVAPNSDLALARKVALDTLNALPFILETPAASMWVESVGDSTINLRMAGWIEQHETSITLARSEAIRLTILAFEKAGIEMPEPGFRIMGLETNAELAATEDTKPRAGSKQKIVVEDVAATANEELEKIVTQEREALKQDDLLDQVAPEE